VFLSRINFNSTQYTHKKYQLKFNSILFNSNKMKKSAIIVYFFRLPVNELKMFKALLMGELVHCVTICGLHLIIPETHMKHTSLLIYLIKYSIIIAHNKIPGLVSDGTVLNSHWAKYCNQNVLKGHVESSQTTCPYTVSSKTKPWTDKY